MRNIMVATDGSEGASRAVDLAAQLAKALGGELSIVAVSTPMTVEEQAQFSRVEGDVPYAPEIFARRVLQDAQ
jgi:nucleotide-binding universal stress UspA family protein